MTNDPHNTEESKASPKAKALSARLSAVQASYQLRHNPQPIANLLDEYLRHRSDMIIEGEPIVQPDGVLLKKILYGTEERRAELETVIDANLKRDATDRDVESLLRAILLCGSYELLVQEVDAPIVINDYLNIGHAFYDRNEVALINGVLDSIAKAFR
ncbi:MAG: transcription antitermination protein NusB [Alphaproteobacteria bacterium]|nr:transcription antitermination protein NusB [Alphaproteobacteria bacterium]